MNDENQVWIEVTQEDINNGQHYDYRDYYCLPRRSMNCPIARAISRSISLPVVYANGAIGILNKNNEEKFPLIHIPNAYKKYAIDFEHKADSARGKLYNRTKNLSPFSFPLNKSDIDRLKEIAAKQT